ncbi:major facilitator superfamily transporter [Verticillium dahliae]
MELRKRPPERYERKFLYCEHLSSWRQHFHSLASGTVSRVHSPSEMGSAESDPNKSSLPYEPEVRSLIIGASITAVYAVAAGVMILVWPACKSQYCESQTRPLKGRSRGHRKLICNY